MPPSSDEYEKLRREAEMLRGTSLSDQSPAAVKRRQMQSGLHAYVRYTGIGLQFLLVIGLGVAAGFGLDHWLGTSPWFVLAGSLLGSVGAMIWVVRAVKRMESSKEETKKQESNKDKTL